MADQFCDWCHRQITDQVIWDHGKRYHPSCYPKAMDYAEEVARRKAFGWRTTCPPECDICRRKRTTGDWSEEKYET